MYSYDGIDDRSAVDQCRVRSDVCSDWLGPQVTGMKRFALPIIIEASRFHGEETGWAQAGMGSMNSTGSRRTTPESTAL